MPTLPAPDGPLLTVKPLRKTSILRSRQLPVRVGCDTVCTATTNVVLSPRTQPKKGKRVAINVNGPKVTVPAGESKIVRVRLSKAQAASLRKALKGKKGLTASLTVTASASVGSPTTFSDRLNVSG